MIILLIVIFVISAIFLILFILIQDEQGEGFGGLLGGGGTSTFGSRKGNTLTRVTTIIASIFLLTALSVAWLNRSISQEDLDAQARVKRIEEQESSDWYVETRSPDESPPATTEEETTPAATLGAAEESESSSQEQP